MKTLVVYESMWGNTEEVARAIAQGVAEMAEVRILDVTQAPPDPDTDLTLIVAGGPTHAFSMTRPKTRADAAQKGAPHGSVDRGLREWLSSLPTGPHAPAVATFDTKIDKARHLPGSAAKSAAKTARKHGYHTETSESFYVSDLEGPLLPGELERLGLLHDLPDQQGPLLPGELERAKAWGRHLAESLMRSSA